MIIYHILLILQYHVSTTVMDLVVVFALFVFMLALPCFCLATVFSMNEVLYIDGPACVSLCLLDASVSPAKTAEPIDILIGLWSAESPKNDMLRGGTDPYEKGPCAGNTWACRDLPAVNNLKISNLFARRQ